MDNTGIFQAISTHGLSLVLVVVFMYAIYKAIVTLWNYYILQQEKQEVREQNIITQLKESSNVINETNELNKELSISNRSLIDTNKTLVDKLSVEMVTMQNDIKTIDNKLDDVINKK